MKTLAILTLLLLVSALALAQGSITAVRIPTSIAGAGGSGTTGFPYSVFVQITGWTANANGQAYLKVYSSTNNEFMWSATGVWSNTTTFSSANQPVATIDGSGNWSGWIYAKHNDALGTSGSVRAAKVGATTTRLTTAAVNFSVLNMTGAGNGGWLVRTSSSSVNKGIVAYAGGASVGTYRTEDNAVTEGYSYSAGGFKIAVPAGLIDSLVTFNDDGTRFESFPGPWLVSAGQETDATSGGGGVGKGSASFTPSTLSGGASHSLIVNIAGAPSDTIRNARVIIPATWSWTDSAADLLLSGGGSPVGSIAGDTINVSNMTLVQGDTLHAQFTNLTPADSTANFTFNVRTGASADSVYPIAVQPAVFIYGSPLAIAVVKENDANGVPLKVNQLVTVRGVVTVANEFGGPSYIQDNSAGFAIFGSSFSTAVQVGDEVLVSGLVQPFNGLSEIVNPVVHSIVSSGNQVDPLIVTAGEVAADGAGGVEQYEGLLIRMNGVTVTDMTGSPIATWAVSGSGTNYRLNDASGQVDVRVDNGVNFANAPAPQSSFDVIGVVSQFKNASPYIGGYQVMPRSTSDILSSGPVISSFPTESNLDRTSMTISWTTLNPGTTRLWLGKTTAYELGIVSPTDSPATSHSIDLAGLDPGTIYNVRAFSSSGTDTSFAANLVVSTVSPVGSTGQMNVYFNFDVNTALSSGEAALGNQDLTNRLIARINAARYSIDAAFYNLSSSPGAAVASALVAAKNRGVQVRVVCEQDNSSNAPFITLSNSGVPVISDQFDATNGGVGLMHNKFAVIDYHGGAPESVWVWTGSWNPSDPGTNSDHQNSIEIQDVSLAGAYSVEFNEMWGSTTLTPNASTTRFGARKVNITPHKFIINGHPVESYFSPSDRTTSKIASALSRAQGSVCVALLTFTRKDLADTLLALKNRGRKVRVVLDNNTDTGNQFAYLQSAGTDIHLKGFSTGLLHHKYAVIDGAQTGGTQWLITGSHNWSSSAENSNDENTLIIQNNRIANLYLQEFGARYTEAGGADPIVLDIREIGHTLPSHFSLSQNYPNPFNPTTSFEFQVAKQGPVSLKVYDVLGREVASLLEDTKAPGTFRVTWDAGGLASGVYFYKMRAGDFSEIRKMMLVR